MRLLLTAALTLLATPALALEPGEPSNPSACTQAPAPSGGDDTAALQAKLNNAINYSPYCVKLQSGTYHIYGDLVINNVSMIGAGQDVTIISTPEANNRRIVVMGRTSTRLKYVGKFTVTAPYTGNDTGNNEAIYLGNPGGIGYGAEDFTNRYTIDHVTINYSEGTGIASYGFKQGRITNNKIVATDRDGIHLAENILEVYVGGNLMLNVGDDKIALLSTWVSGVSNPVYQITVENNMSVNSISVAAPDGTNNNYANLRGRGITVLGPKHITVRGNEVHGSPWACYLVVQETGENWDTYGSRNVWVENNKGYNCGQSIDNNQSAFEVRRDWSYLTVDDIYLKTNEVFTASIFGAYYVDPGVQDAWCNGNKEDGATYSPISDCTTGGPGTTTGTYIDGTLNGGTAASLPTYP